MRVIIRASAIPNAVLDFATRIVLNEPMSDNYPNDRNRWYSLLIYECLERSLFDNSEPRTVLVLASLDLWRPNVRRHLVKPVRHVQSLPSHGKSTT
jgi:hypothetical protein